ncbi:fibronectin type III domain-containing protein [Leadbettera azotonutricia]|uniref:Fibronectin type III domain protein n=1 Tax=Leadbettera azotonutricia (strain ATCC BAA-888 / DSM 13862 / ZAS-9) TaxID=545695 RepID=F5Y766_LEAAZ|nr:fibronectin type III domain-containing protein [Leadbettera azotonutricia]AEF82223.1 fibronectin type III domain protein [Leadbettera azotonutricia ZAS-9]
MHKRWFIPILVVAALAALIFSSCSSDGGGSTPASASIDEVYLDGIVIPAHGGIPFTKTDLEAVVTSYTVSRVQWVEKGSDGGYAAFTGNFEVLHEYKATITLSTASNFHFIDTLTNVSLDKGTPSNLKVASGGKTLTFDVVFAKIPYRIALTAVSENSNSTTSIKIETSPAITDLVINDVIINQGGNDIITPSAGFNVTSSTPSAGIYFLPVTVKSELPAGTYSITVTIERANYIFVYSSSETVGIVKDNGPPRINTVGISGLEAPVAGQSPVAMVGVSDPGAYLVSSFAWRLKNGGANHTGPFVLNTEYEAVIALTAVSLYEFPNNPADITVNIGDIQGTKAVTILDTQHLTLVVGFGPASSALVYVNLTRDGAAGSSSTSYIDIQTTPYISNLTTAKIDIDFGVTGAQKQLYSDIAKSPAGENIWRQSITFPTAAGSASGTITVQLDLGEGSQIYYTPQDGVIGIFYKAGVNSIIQQSPVTITGVTAPSAGGSPTLSGLAGVESSFGVKGLIYRKVGETSQVTGEFAGNTDYEAYITLEANTSYKFDAASKARPVIKLKGSNDTFYTVTAWTETKPANTLTGDGNEISFTVPFARTGTKPLKHITAVTIGGVSAPVVGGAPDTTIIPGSSEYTISNINWQGAGGAALASGGTYDGKFKGDSSYVLEITLTAAAGYCFQEAFTPQILDEGTAAPVPALGSEASNIVLKVTFPTNTGFLTSAPVTFSTHFQMGRHTTGNASSTQTGDGALTWSTDTPSAITINPSTGAITALSADDNITVSYLSQNKIFRAEAGLIVNPNVLQTLNLDYGVTEFQGFAGEQSAEPSIDEPVGSYTREYSVSDTTKATIAGNGKLTIVDTGTVTVSLALIDSDDLVAYRAIPAQITVTKWTPLAVPALNGVGRNTKVSLSWTKPTGNPATIARITGYEIAYNNITTSGSEQTLAVTGADVLTVDVNSLANSDVYSFKIRAVYGKPAGEERSAYTPAASTYTPKANGKDIQVNFDAPGDSAQNLNYQDNEDGTFTVAISDTTYVTDVVWRRSIVGNPPEQVLFDNSGAVTGMTYSITLDADEFDADVTNYIMISAKTSGADWSSAVSFTVTK